MVAGKREITGRLYVKEGKESKLKMLLERTGKDNHERNKGVMVWS